jgi:uncharacterized protein (DUF1330 family)
MPAYWMGRATFSDVKWIEKYVATNKENKLGERYPHTLLARDGQVAELEGGIHFEHYYLWEFPSLEVALEMYHSKEYQAAAEFRRKGCSAVELVVFEGGDHYTGKY